MRTILQAAVLTAAVLAPAAAQAAPAPQQVTTMLGTYGFGRAAVIGQGGKQAAVWSAFSTRSGITGDDLIITYRPRFKPYPDERLVYSANQNEVKDPQAECRKVGADGVTRRVWLSYRCRTGIVANYTLLVR